MATQNLVLIETICTHYEIETAFLNSLDDLGLIQIVVMEQSAFIHKDKIRDLEKMIRLHRELEVNVESLDIIFNLLAKIDDLQQELLFVKNRLRLYEGERFATR